jgi:hypothetical protein
VNGLTILAGAAAGRHGDGGRVQRGAIGPCHAGPNDADSDPARHDRGTGRGRCCRSGLVDDTRGLSPRARLLPEGAIGAGAWAGGLGISLSGIAGVDLTLTVVWVAAMTNGFNLLDIHLSLASGSPRLLRCSGGLPPHRDRDAPGSGKRLETHKRCGVLAAADGGGSEGEQDE